MREEERIDRICDKIRTLWKKHPDQRLGQLLFNYAWGENRLFYVEDYETEMELDLELGITSPIDSYKRFNPELCKHGIDISFCVSACPICFKEIMKKLKEEK